MAFGRKFHRLTRAPLRDETILVVSEMYNSPVLARVLDVSSQDDSIYTYLVRIEGKLSIVVFPSETFISWYEAEVWCAV